MNTEPGPLEEKRKNVQQRPTAMVEVRAWLAVALAILVQSGAAIWWAAGLSAKVENLQTSVTEVKTDMKAVQQSAQTAAQAAEDKNTLLRLVSDHESRLRDLERSKR
ncbi:hypothetical protein [Methylibium sp.]|uniref:hypothetical protein n=1 Tax=Methylibium sp. TaxID=2067992 RepID=UPI003BACC6F3